MSQFATSGDRNPVWFDEFSTDPIRQSDMLPGGLDPIEKLEICLYDRRTLSPATMLFSAVTEVFLIAKVSIPLQLLRLHLINQWFVMEPAFVLGSSTSSSSPPPNPEEWCVTVHATINMKRKRRISA